MMTGWGQSVGSDLGWWWWWHTKWIKQMEFNFHATLATWNSTCCKYFAICRQLRGTGNLGIGGKLYYMCARIINIIYTTFAWFMFCLSDYNDSRCVRSLLIVLSDCTCGRRKEGLGKWLGERLRERKSRKLQRKKEEKGEAMKEWIRMRKRVRRWKEWTDNQDRKERMFSEKISEE